MLHRGRLAALRKTCCIEEDSSAQGHGRVGAEGAGGAAAAAGPRASGVEGAVDTRCGAGAVPVTMVARPLGEAVGEDVESLSRCSYDSWTTRRSNQPTSRRCGRMRCGKQRPLSSSVLAVGRGGGEQMRRQGLAKPGPEKGNPISFFCGQARGVRMAPLSQASAYLQPTKQVHLGSRESGQGLANQPNRPYSFSGTPQLTVSQLSQHKQ